MSAKATRAARKPRPRTRRTRPAPIIDSLASLRAHLQMALEVEHATIPPYFTAWLSIQEGHNYEAAETIRGVMLEEMLHLTLAANLLNAVGGRPSLTHRDFVPRYPHRLPHSGNRFEISIERFSRAALGTFLQIERPEPKGGRPEPGHFHTIGQFYAAIGEAIDRLCDRLGERRVFSGHRRRQIRPKDYYGAGSIVVVTSRDTAHRAIAEIVEQGEGAHDGIFDRDHRILGEGGGQEVAHYYRYMEILKGRRYTQHDTAASGPRGGKLPVDYRAVYPIRANTRAGDYPRGSETRAALEAFGRGYGELLAALERAFGGHRDQLTQGIARMFSLKHQALALIRTPTGDGKTTVGLDFRAGMR